MVTLTISIESCKDSDLKVVEVSCAVPDEMDTSACYFAFNRDTRVEALNSAGMISCRVSCDDLDMTAVLKVMLFCGHHCLATGTLSTAAKAQRMSKRIAPLEGRFSGRLASKEDEQRLVEECVLLAPLVLGPKAVKGGGCEEDVRRGGVESARMTISKLVRCIASGEMREYCEQREEASKALQKQVIQLTHELSVALHTLERSSRSQVEESDASIGDDAEGCSAADLLSRLDNQQAEVARTKIRLRKKMLEESFSRTSFVGPADLSAFENSNGLESSPRNSNSLPRPSPPGSKRSVSELELGSLISEEDGRAYSSNPVRGKEEELDAVPQAFSGQLLHVDLSTEPMTSRQSQSVVAVANARHSGSRLAPSYPNSRSGTLHPLSGGLDPSNPSKSARSSASGPDGNLNLSQDHVYSQLQYRYSQQLQQEQLMPAGAARTSSPYPNNSSSLCGGRVYRSGAANLRDIGNLSTQLQGMLHSQHPAAENNAAIANTTWLPQSSLPLDQTMMHVRDSRVVEAQVLAQRLQARVYHDQLSQQQLQEQHQYQQWQFLQQIQQQQQQQQLQQQQQQGYLEDMQVLQQPMPVPAGMILGTSPTARGSPDFDAFLDAMCDQNAATTE